MTGSLNPTCPLCGLRYTSKPLLELHIREDHRPRRRARSGRRDLGVTRPSPLPAASSSGQDGLAARPSETAKEVIVMTAARHPRPRPATTVTRGTIRVLRHVNDELMRASEAIIRSARAPQARPLVPASAARATGQDAAAERIDQAA
jgi:hypothetical protein